MTPLMKQYWEVKSAHPDKVVLFRMGDFFEMFHDDAVLAAPILGIALTARNKKAQDETPMCGVPHHSISGPIAKLLAAGHKVAICEQIEDPKLAKGLVKRAVTRILSPGMVYDLATLDGAQNNRIVTWDDSTVSCIDLSTGEFVYTNVRHHRELAETLQALRPVEVLLPPGPVPPEVSSALQGRHTTPWSEELKSRSQLTSGQDRVAKWPDSAQRLFAYVESAQGEDVRTFLGQPEARAVLCSRVISQETLSQLEVFATYKGEREGSLFHVMDRTQTSMGRRLLKAWLEFPLTDRTSIEERWNGVEKWQRDFSRLESIRRALPRAGDLERRLARVSQPGSNARDLRDLAASIVGTQEALDLAGEALRAGPVWELAEKLHQHLVDEPGLSVREGGMIRRGVNAELDRWMDLVENSQGLLRAMEEREKAATGIPSLKIRYNQVFGYYIEITHTHRDRVPAHYQRKQTLANAERYTTDELVDLEKDVLSASARRADLEYDLFVELRKSALTLSAPILHLARAAAHVDVLTSLAWLAIENRYVRPQWSEEGALELVHARHPVVERQTQRKFVSNSLVVRQGEVQLLTGPNMAGKSTLMRQVALLVLMAQAGSFVPAQQVKLPLYDRILTRIGASDALAEGLSTFMVEMRDCAHLLKEHSAHALVILDEIGRGTSTYDGLSLARAILEHFLELKQGQVFFATHYHELPALQAQHDNLLNAHMGIAEEKGEIRFLYTLRSGAARRSYGLHVARLAGVPSSVVRRAEGHLRELEQDHRQLSLLEEPRTGPVSGSAAADRPVGPLFHEPNARPCGASAELEGGQLALRRVVESIRALNLEEVRPVDLVRMVEDWQREMSDAGHLPPDSPGARRN